MIRKNNPNNDALKPKFATLVNSITGEEAVFVNRDGVTYRHGDPDSPRLIMSRQVFNQVINAVSAFSPWKPKCGTFPEQ